MFKYIYRINDGIHVPDKVYVTNDGVILCKQCNTKNEEIKEAIQLDKMVQNLTIKCENSIMNMDKRVGCNWNGFVKDYNDHLINECQYKDLKKYLRNDNENDIIECPLKCGFNIKRRNIETHKYNECNNYLIECKHNGCNNYIKRNEFLNHINNECQYINVACPYKKYGCNVNNLIKKDLDVHLNNDKVLHYLYKIDYDNNIIKERMKNIEIMLKNNNIEKQYKKEKIFSHNKID